MHSLIQNRGNNNQSALTRIISADHILLLVAALACYWPFSLGLFSAKNDNIIAVLPLRYNISEAIGSGHLPFWSPYIYLGFPLHGDMQSGCWNPFVWFFSIFTTYDLTVLHIEILCYIFLSGLGMYKLLQTLTGNRTATLCGSIAYMMCGFVTDVGGSNILFLAGGAFIPFVFHSYYRFLQNPSLRPALGTALALSMLFLTAYPSFFILTCYVLLAAVLAYCIMRLYKKSAPKALLRPLVLYHLVLGFCFLAICSPALISYWELLPYYKRGSSISLAYSSVNSFHPLCSLSFLFPTAAIKNPASFSTDLISRNSYFNSFLLVFAFLSLWGRKGWTRFFIAAGIIYFFLFSLGDYTPVRAWSYHLPLMDTFRHPSNARLFVIIGAIVLSSFGLAAFLDGKTSIKKSRWIISLFLFICLGFLIFSLLNLSGAPVSVSADSGLRTRLKDFLEQLGFYEVLLFNAGLQALLLAWLLYWTYHRPISGKMVLAVFILNSFLFAQFSMPYTFSGKTSPAGINSLLRSFPKGYPEPSLDQSLEQNSESIPEDYEKIGLTNFYNKEPGMRPVVVSPTFLTSLERLLQDTIISQAAFRQPFAYLADTVLYRNGLVSNSFPVRTVFMEDSSVNMEGSAGDNSVLEFSYFSNNCFRFTARAGSERILCLQQVLLPGWKARIDKRPAEILRANIAFMGIAVPAGTHEIEFSYRPALVYCCLYISLFAILLTCILLFFHKKRN